MDLRLLRYLVALADEGSFTRAAAAVWVTQQGMSKAIAQLERRAGERLVDRGRQGVTLTPAGRRLVAAARPLLEAAARVEQVLADPAGRPAGDVLRVGMLLDGLGPRTAGLVAAFRAVRPDLRMRLQRVQPPAIPGVLLSGEVDVALVHGPVSDPRVAMVPLFTERRVVALSAADPHADAQTLGVADLLDLPALVRRPDVDPVWEGVFTLRAERNGEEPQRLGEPTHSLEELLWAISLDGAFLTVPEHLAGAYGRDTYGVVFVPVRDLAPVTFAVAFRREDSRPEVRDFLAAARAATAGGETSRPSQHNQELLDGPAGQG